MIVAAPTVLLPYQQRWIADKSQIKVIEKSRRIGISWAEAADCALAAAARDGGENSWYLGYNQEMSQEFINDVGFWAKNYQLSASEGEEFVLKDQDKDILAYRVKFASGKRVTALSSRPSNLRGKQGRVVIDEAAFHEDLPELLKAAIAFLVWGGRVHIISTHDGVDGAFNRLIKDIRGGRKNYSLHRVTLDDAIADGLVKRICLKRGQAWSPEFEKNWRAEIFEAYGDDADEELLVIPSKNNRLYFSSELVETRMRYGNVLRFKLPDNFTLLDEVSQKRLIHEWISGDLAFEINRLPRNLKSFYGLDFGRLSDMTAIAVILEKQNLSRECPLIIELRNVPFREQELILTEMIKRLPRFYGGAHDARGNGHALAEAMQRKRYGSDIQAVMLTENWYQENFPRYKAALEDRSLTIVKDSDVLADHQAVKVDKGIPKIQNQRYKGTDGLYRHGDTTVALVLGHFAATNSKGKNTLDSLRGLFV